MSAIEAIRNYVKQRAGRRGLDSDVIHGLDSGCDTEAELRLSDLNALLSMLRSTCFDEWADEQKLFTTRRRDALLGWNAACGSVEYDWRKTNESLNSAQTEASELRDEIDRLNARIETMHAERIEMIDSLNFLLDKLRDAIAERETS